MTHIPLREDLRGIVSLFDFRPETARPLRELAEVLLCGPSSLTRAERELIATHVSTLNRCEFCAQSHSAIATALLSGDGDIPRRVATDYTTAPISQKMKALLAVATAVQRSGRAVSRRAIGTARSHGASDTEIHDTVLIAAAFCMYNRYVDGLATVPAACTNEYDQAARHIASAGYLQ